MLYVFRRTRCHNFILVSYNLYHPCLLSRSPSNCCPFLCCALRGGHRGSLSFFDLWSNHRLQHGSWLSQAECEAHAFMLLRSVGFSFTSLVASQVRRVRCTYVPSSTYMYGKWSHVVWSQLSVRHAAREGGIITLCATGKTEFWEGNDVARENVAGGRGEGSILSGGIRLGSVSVLAMRAHISHVCVYEADAAGPRSPSSSPGTCSRRVLGGPIFLTFS